MAYYDFKTEGSGAKAYYLGTLAHGSTMNVAAKYADYANLTKDNFVIVPQSNSGSASNSSQQSHPEWSGWTSLVTGSGSASYSAPSISYNPSNGQLSFSSTLSYSGTGTCASVGGWWSDSATGSGSKGLTAKVYLLPEIEDIS